MVVVGGANSAGQAALNLAEFAEAVTMIVRSDSLASRMSRYLVERVEGHERIEVYTETDLVRADGEGALEVVHVSGASGQHAIPANALSS